MIFSMFDSDIRVMVIRLLIYIPTILISLTFHEYAHAFAADKLGDPTAKNLGRLTLNPAKHLDLVGTLMMLFVGVGYAKPVPVNSRYFKKPKWGMALTAVAGPLMNLILSFLGAALYILYARFLAALLPFSVTWAIAQFTYIFSYLNAYLAFFNLIPIPPFDGSRLAFVFLPERIYWGVMKYERIILVVIIIAILALGRFGINPISNLADMFVGSVEKLFSLILGF